MPDFVTPYKGLTEPTVGSDNNTWGGILNTDFSLIDSALGGTVSISISGTTTAITSTQAQNTGFIFSGSLSATNTVTWPAFFGIATINNQTSGGHSISCGVSGGSFITILSGETVAIWSDGTNFVRLCQPIYPGDLKPVTYTSAPTGWLYCDGSAVSRTTYAALFNKINTAFGAGNGTTTFNIPDMRGRVAAGYDASNSTSRLTASTSQGVSASTLGNTGGEQDHTLVTGELSVHNHSLGSGAAGKGGFIMTSYTPGTDANIGGANNTGGEVAGSSDNTGGGSAHNNIQPTLIVGWIIKT